MLVTRDRGLWRCQFVIEDFPGDDLTAEPLRRVECGNLLMHGGASVMWQCLIGNGTASSGAALTFFSNANAAIGAGDGTTAAVATQTNLQGSNRLRKGMDSTYPTSTSGTTSGDAVIVFRSTFNSGEGNFDWREIAIANSVSDGVGRMLNRVVQNIGVKTSAISRQITATITLS